MGENKLQLSPDTWVYVDTVRSKLIVEIDLPQEDDETLEKTPACPATV